MSDTGLKREKLFADICSKRYLNGFVFHSPKVNDPTEREIGDIIIWVRTQLIIFEMISRESESSSSLKSFTKRVGAKRSQLQKDFDFFSTLGEDIVLQNEDGQSIKYLREYFVRQGFLGTVLVDFGNGELTLHYRTIEKSLAIEFPVNFLHYEGFLKVIHELDTVADIYFYLLDRARFSPYIFEHNPKLLLNINQNFEPNLLAFYKMNENSFPKDVIDFNSFPQYWNQYQVEYKHEIIARDAENDGTHIIDQIIRQILDARTESNNETIFAWELSTLTRRQRATFLTDKVADAFVRLRNGNAKRFFSYFNAYTECWILFYFSYGGTTDSFRDEFDRLVRLKTIFEATNNDFVYSTFGYGFRKSQLKTTNALYDDLVMNIQDVTELGPVTRKVLKEANIIFGHSIEMEVKEFPDIESE